MNRKKGAKLKERTELLYGIRPVLGALQHSKRLLNQLYLKKDADSSERLREIRILAEKIKLPVSEVPVSQLTVMCPDAVHQGVVLRCGFCRLPACLISHNRLLQHNHYFLFLIK